MIDRILEIEEADCRVPEGRNREFIVRLGLAMCALTRSTFHGSDDSPRVCERFNGFIEVQHRLFAFLKEPSGSHAADLEGVLASLAEIAVTHGVEPTLHRALRFVLSAMGRTGHARLSSVPQETANECKEKSDWPFASADQDQRGGAISRA